MTSSSPPPDSPTSSAAGVAVATDAWSLPSPCARRRRPRSRHRPRAHHAMLFLPAAMASRQDVTRIQDQVRSAWLRSSRSASECSAEQCGAKSDPNSCKCEEHGICNTWSRYARVSRAPAGGSCLCLGRVFEVEQNAVRTNIFALARRRTAQQLRHLPAKSPRYGATESASGTGRAQTKAAF